MGSVRFSNFCVGSIGDSEKRLAKERVLQFPPDMASLADDAADAFDAGDVPYSPPSVSDESTAEMIMEKLRKEALEREQKRVPIRSDSGAITPWLEEETTPTPRVSENEKV